MLVIPGTFLSGKDHFCQNDKTRFQPIILLIIYTQYKHSVMVLKPVENYESFSSKGSEIILQLTSRPKFF